jgi:2-methylisocitrate lyase-like PEP mutase family enzyme
MTGQSAKAAAFKSLHEQPGAFVIPNPWDIGSARMLATFGFKALATTSAGFSFSLGRADDIGVVGREETLDHLNSIVGATDLPVSADLQHGFGDLPEVCAETIRLAAGAGLVGGSIEDATGRVEEPIYPFDVAVERVKAAVAAARALSFPFMLTARAENYLNGRPDMPDTIGAGRHASWRRYALVCPRADRRWEAVAPKPVNVVMGLSGADFSVADLAALGVKRVSVGSAMARAAYGAFLRATREVAERGTFTFARDAVPFAEINKILDRQS